jgi:predicted TPR repeat methyltransferase
MTKGFGKPLRRDRTSATAATQATEMLDLGLVLHRQGRLVEAIVRYRQALNFRSDYAEAYYALGIAFQTQGSYEEAETNFRAAAQLKPADVEIHFALGSVLQQAGEIEAAKSAYGRALAIDPEHAKTYRNLGLLAKEQGQFPEATAHLRNALLIAPDFLEACLDLAEVERDQDHLSEALQLLKRAILIKPDCAEAYFELARIHHEQNHLAEAISNYRTVLVFRPDLPEVHANLANALQSLGRSAEAEISFRKTLALKPDFAEIHCGLGHALRDQDKLSEAAESYQNALALRPNYPEAMHFLAVVTGENPEFTDPDYVVALFDTYADQFDEHLVEDLAYNIPRELTAALQEIRSDLKDLTILDLGCGTGLCGPLLKPFAKTLTGVDLSAKMLVRAEERQVYDHCIQSEIVAFLKMQAQSSDLIVAADVLPYIGNLEPLFAASFDALRSEGLFAFSVEEGVENYALKAPSGRFFHAPAYVRTQANQSGFVEVLARETVVRTEDGEPSAGWLFIFRRPT